MPSMQGNLERGDCWSSLGPFEYTTLNPLLTLKEGILVELEGVKLGRWTVMEMDVVEREPIKPFLRRPPPCLAAEESRAIVGF